MTLQEAIEILENDLRGDEPDNPHDLPDALRLGIEALKRVQKYRPLYAGKYPHLLPGETKD